MLAKELKTVWLGAQPIAYLSERLAEIKVALGSSRAERRRARGRVPSPILGSLLRTLALGRGQLRLWEEAVKRYKFRLSDWSCLKQ